MKRHSGDVPTTLLESLALARLCTRHHIWCVRKMLESTAVAACRLVLACWVFWSLSMRTNERTEDVSYCGGRNVRVFG